MSHQNRLGSYTCNNGTHVKMVHPFNKMTINWKYNLGSIQIGDIEILELQNA